MIGVARRVHKRTLQQTWFRWVLPAIAFFVALSLPRVSAAHPFQRSNTGKLFLWESKVYLALENTPFVNTPRGPRCAFEVVQQEPRFMPSLEDPLEAPIEEAPVEEPVASPDSLRDESFREEASEEDSLPEAEFPSDEREPPKEPCVLSGGSEEVVETMLFDAYLGGNFTGAILLDYTDCWFEVTDPDGLIEQLEQLKTPEAVRPLFVGRVEGERRMPAIGSMKVDLNTFRLIIEIDPKYLLGTNFTIGGRVPDPVNSWSFEQRFQAASSGDIEGNFNSAVNHQSRASFGKYWGDFDGTWIQEGDYEVFDLSAKGIVDDFEVSTGLLRSDGQFFTASSDYVGLSAITARELYLDQELLRGSLLEIFVPSRSRVEFFQGNRLLSVQTLDFGLQEVNTRAFPQGSYDVDIVIKEDSGRITREKRFFTKSGLLALRDRPSFFFHGGLLRDALDVSAKPLYQAGMAYRTSDSSQVSLSAYGVDDVTYGAIEGILIFRALTFRAGYLHSTRDDSAYTASHNGAVGPFSWDFSITEALTGFAEPQDFVDDDPLGEITSLGLEEDEDETFEVGSNTRQRLNGNLRLVLGDFSLRYSVNRSESVSALGEEQSRYAYGPRADWTFYRYKGASARMQASLFNTNEGKEGAVLLSFSYRLGNWDMMGEGSYIQNELSKETSLISSAVYDNKASSGKGLRAGFTDDLRFVDQDASSGVQTGEGWRAINRVEVDYMNDVIRTEGFVRDQRSDDTDFTAIGANVSSSFLINEDGGLDIVSPPQNEALFVAEVASSTTESVIEVIVNGQVKETVKAGESVAVGLEPYRSYRVGIRPTEQADLVTYDTTFYDITLFPGNIVKKTWKMKKVYIALGRLLDEGGKPIPWQRVKGTSEYAFTEVDGTFQIELTGDEDLRVESATYNCVVELPEIESADFFHDYGDVTCRSSDGER